MPNPFFLITVNALQRTIAINSEWTPPVYKFNCIETKVMDIIDTYPELPKSKKSSIKSHGLPVELVHITKAIKDAKYINYLKDNWDGEGAIKVPEFIFERAVGFLKNYSIKVLNIYNKVLEEPEILPLKDGSIDLMWENEKANLVIRIKNIKQNMAFYYGEFLNMDYEKFDVNGEIPTNNIEDSVVSWFSNFPKMGN